ncbi:glycosyltransferase [Alkalinema sp. FACHB-956]|uniref:glycosyltransferase n=1 Tax=Alkalinema sp. FACHB-956 TaxID=2692768 RepID=UPI00168534B1|nr:glycosyltransferase [Alkalinema sp. FACHB-956]MBD2327175.1 glycosyltransferase [Alkalinema sp. FACHB-956]
MNGSTKAEDWPTFSMILETENLATADPQGLMKSLASLAAQQPSPSLANEVLLIDSGDTPPELLESLQQQHPWLLVKTAPPQTEYYAAKMLGAEWATGDIVVYYDSDCIYDRHWLRTLLQSFRQPDVQVVAGETTTNGVGLYGTAMALTYIFPQYSGESDLQPTSQYFLNNVAFRRSFLLQNPIPTDLPLYRGNCVLHAQNLLAAGHQIWRQPQARSLHAPPNGWNHFFWRFLLIGHDLYWQKRLLAKTPKSPMPKSPQGQQNPTLTHAEDPTIGDRGKLAIFRDRVSKMVQRDRRHAFYLPFCLPIVIFSALLIYVGYLITLRRPHYLLQTFDRVAETQ